MVQDDFSDDLQDLLDQLDESDDLDGKDPDQPPVALPKLTKRPSASVSAQKPPKPTPPKVAPPKPVSDDPLDALEDLDDPTDGAAMRPIDVRKMGDGKVESQIVGELTREQTTTVSLDIDKYRKQLDIVTAEVLEACHSDRQETQDVINMLRGYLNNNHEPTKAIVDGLVKAVEVKANINQNAIRIVEANSKFLSAVKTQVKIEDTIAISGGELSDFLDQKH